MMIYIIRIHYLIAVLMKKSRISWIMYSNRYSLVYSTHQKTDEKRCLKRKSGTNIFLLNGKTSPTSTADYSSAMNWIS